MCGCCRRAAILISRRNRSGPSDGGELGAQDLERDRAVVPEVVGEVDRGHAAASELALEAVAVGQGDDRTSGVAHEAPAVGGSRGM